MNALPSLTLTGDDSVVHLRNDLDQRDLRDATCIEGGQVDVELVGIEAHRHVEGEARRDDGAWRGAAAKVTTPVAGSQLKPEPTACSTPLSATRTVPPTGLAITWL